MSSARRLGACMCVVSHCARHYMHGSSYVRSCIACWALEPHAPHPYGYNPAAIISPLGGSTSHAGGFTWHATPQLSQSHPEMRCPRTPAAGDASRMSGEDVARLTDLIPECEFVQRDLDELLEQLAGKTASKRRKQQDYCSASSYLSNSRWVRLLDPNSDLNAKADYLIQFVMHLQCISVMLGP